MTKVSPKAKAAAAKVCRDIRYVLAVHRVRSGWTVRPNHAHADGPCIQIGHSAPDMQEEIDTLLTVVNFLKLAPPGYVFRKA